MLRISKKNFFLFLPLIIFIGIIYNALSQEPPAKPEPRNIPGITSPDLYPHGCVSCHKNYPEMKIDARLSTIMTEWKEKGVSSGVLTKSQSIAPEGVTLKGKHPYKVGPDDNIPEVCNKCHGKSTKTAFPLSDLLHVIHLTGGKDNNFITMFNGDCTNCHKLNLQTGKWSNVNAKESDEEEKK